MNDNQNGQGLSVCTCGHSNLHVVIYHLISSKFHKWIFKPSPKFEYGCCPMNNNQDGSQDGSWLSVGTCGHS